MNIMEKNGFCIKQGMDWDDSKKVIWASLPLLGLRPDSVHRVCTGLKRVLNIQDCLEKSLKTKSALKST